MIQGIVIDAGDRALRQILEDALRIADRCVNPDDRDSITKTVSNVESMLDALCELRQQGKVSASTVCCAIRARHLCNRCICYGESVRPSVCLSVHHLSLIHI